MAAFQDNDGNAVRGDSAEDRRQLCPKTVGCPDSLSIALVQLLASDGRNGCANTFRYKAPMEDTGNSLTLREFNDFAPIWARQRLDVGDRQVGAVADELAERMSTVICAHWIC